MSVIAVCKEMNEDEAVMEPDSNLICRECSVFYPVAGVSDEDRELLPHLVMGNGNVLLGGEIQASPFPSLIEHPPMQLTDVGLRQSIVAGFGKTPSMQTA